VPEILIHGLGTGGDGIGRLDDGQVVFVERALPGDRVEVRLTRKVKRVQHAEIVKLIEPSGERVESRCQVAGCGGCPIRSYSGVGQGEAKTDRIVQALSRIAKQDVRELLGDLVQDGNGWRYRHRVRLHAAWFRNRWNLGYFARRSSRLIPLDAGCPVLCKELEAAALGLGEALAPLSRHAGLQGVEIAYSGRDDRCAARLVATGRLGEFRDSPDWFDRSGLSAAEVIVGEERWRQGDIGLRYDHRRSTQFDLYFEPGVFTQANPGVNNAAVDAVLGALVGTGGAGVPSAGTEANEDPRVANGSSSGPRILELHAGVGNFSLPLALAGADVYAVEHMQRAVSLAQHNAQVAGVGLHAFALEDIEALEEGGPVPPLSEFDAVLLDPPRIGAHAVARRLAEAGPERIVYVSCDPATLARDVKELVAGGYEIAEAKAFDMFPQTPHVEVMLRLQRR